MKGAHDRFAEPLALWRIMHWGPRERLRRAARLSEEAEAPRIRAQLRPDRGDHRCGVAARRATRIVVGDVAQPAGEDAAARGLPRRRLHRDPAGRWKERAVQKGEVGLRSVPHLPLSSSAKADDPVFQRSWK